MRVGTVAILAAAAAQHGGTIPGIAVRSSIAVFTGTVASYIEGGLAMGYDALSCPVPLPRNLPEAEAAARAAAIVDAVRRAHGRRVISSYFGQARGSPYGGDAHTAKLLETRVADPTPGRGPPRGANRCTSESGDPTSYTAQTWRRFNLHRSEAARAGAPHGRDLTFVIAEYDSPYAAAFAERRLAAARPGGVAPRNRAVYTPGKSLLHPTRDPALLYMQLRVEGDALADASSASGAPASPRTGFGNFQKFPLSPKYP